MIWKLFQLFKYLYKILQLISKVLGFRLISENTKIGVKFFSSLVFKN